MTPLQKARLSYKPTLPHILRELNLLIAAPDNTHSPTIPEKIKSLFPHTYNQPFLTFTSQPSQSPSRTHRPLRIGVVFSGGQASGGHNVITGLYDALQKLNPSSELFGFLDGPSGIINNKYIPLPANTLAPYRNQGGFDMIGSGRTKIETSEQFAAAARSVSELRLDGLIIIGGDDSNTNGALLAEYFRSNAIPTAVIGVPKTIDGDLQTDHIEISFGFDTACRVYSEMIGNVLRDCLSAKKYYHFVKLMGRSASHIALECALQTQPNLTLIGEEIAAKGLTLQQVTNQIADMICQRALQKKNYGVVLIPEGLIEFIPEIKSMIKELNTLLANESILDRSKVLEKLSQSAADCLRTLPEAIGRQLLLDRDPHGNINVSKIETERLFIETVKEELAKRAAAGSYSGKFDPQPHFYGYEGRSALPTTFDAQYCYALGYVAALLVEARATGYMACVGLLTRSVEEWTICGVPLTSMLTIEQRKGVAKPVIAKALVDLSGPAFSRFKSSRDGWQMADAYLSPGPTQFFGPIELTDQPPLSL